MHPMRVALSAGLLSAFCDNENEVRPQLPGNCRSTSKNQASRIDYGTVAPCFIQPLLFDHQDGL